MVSNRKPRQQTGTACCESTCNHTCRPAKYLRNITSRPRHMYIYHGRQSPRAARLHTRVMRHRTRRQHLAHKLGTERSLPVSIVDLTSNFNSNLDQLPIDIWLVTPSIDMFVALLFTLAAAASAWLVWKAQKPRPKLDVPLLQFEGDNSMLRYLNDTRSLMKKGYAEVSSYLPSDHRFLLHDNSISKKGGRFRCSITSTSAIHSSFSRRSTWKKSAVLHRRS